MFRVKPENIIHLRPDPSGKNFSDFIQYLVRITVYINKSDTSRVKTSARVNKSDGGIDTCVEIPIQDEIHGWFDKPTVWQFKSVSAKTLNDKINGILSDINNTNTLLNARIQKGYGYRLCVCDDDTRIIEACNQKLNEAIVLINPDSDSMILSASDIAFWADQYPGLLLYKYGSLLNSEGTTLERWGNNLTVDFPYFVHFDKHSDLSDAIKMHVRFDADLPLILHIDGKSGVGKSRFVFETLKEIDGANRLVIYSFNSNDAIKIATSLLNDDIATAILVVDECETTDALEIEKRLIGKRNQVRVITIGTQPIGVSKITNGRISEMTTEEIEQILESNCPELNKIQRRMAAEKSGGYLRLAMCLLSIKEGELLSNDTLYKTIEQIISNIEDEYINILLILSLFHKVGWKDDLLVDLRSICDIFNIADASFLQCIDKIHNRYGFVDIAGRYVKITPEPLSNVLFEKAWYKYVKNNLLDFISVLPYNLKLEFLKNASNAQYSIKFEISSIFYNWAISLKYESLASKDVVDQLCCLIEVYPDTYLIILKELITVSTTDFLKKYLADTRRSIYYLLENMLIFPEYYYTVEKILLKLSIAESEPNIVNNTTNLWFQSNRIILSGSSISFEDRFKTLKEHIYSGSREESIFAVRALEGSLNSNTTRYSTSSSTFSGRLFPSEWKPKSIVEYNNYVTIILMLLKDISYNNKLDNEIRLIVKDIILSKIWYLICYWHIDSAIDILSQYVLTEEESHKLINNMNIAYRHMIDKKLLANNIYYDNRIKIWLNDLYPKEPIDKIMYLLKGYKDYNNIESNTNAFEDIVNQIQNSPNILLKHYDRIANSNGYNLFMLGMLLGTRDDKMLYIDLLIEKSKISYSPISSGYIKGILNSSKHNIQIVNNLIDTIEESYPNLAFAYSLVGGDVCNSLSRALKYIDLGKLDVAYLGNFIDGIETQNKKRELTLKEKMGIFSRLYISANRGNKEALKIGLQFVYKDLEKKRNNNTILRYKTIVRKIFTMIRIGLQPKHNTSITIYWKNMMIRMCKYDVDAVIKIILNVVYNDSSISYTEGMLGLNEIATKYPSNVLKELTKYIYDNKKKWRFIYNEDIKTLLYYLASGANIKQVKGWLKTNGEYGASFLARHLQEPFIDGSDNVVVPALTEYVLTEYEESEDVFNEFCAGSFNHVYGPDIESQANKEIEMLKRLERHHIKRLREWAARESRHISNFVKSVRDHTSEIMLR